MGAAGARHHLAVNNAGGLVDIAGTPEILGQRHDAQTNEDSHGNAQQSVVEWACGLPFGPTEATPDQKQNQGKEKQDE